MSFGKLRAILQDSKPDLVSFKAVLNQKEVKKEDMDLLLRQVCKSKASPFGDFCSALVEKGANINFYDSKDHISNLMLACQKGNSSMVQSLLQYQKINITHTDTRQLHAGFYVVQNKSSKDSQAIMKLLITKEPSIVNLEAGHQTLLIAAIRKLKVELVKLLLQAGADPNWQVPDTGNTSLHDAVKQYKSKPGKNITQIIRLLLLKGADSTKKNKQQKTVYDYTQKYLAQYRRIEQLVHEQLLQQQQKLTILYTLNNSQSIQKLYNEAYTLFGQYQQDSQQQQPYLSQSFLCQTLTQQILSFQRQSMVQYQCVQKQLKMFLIKLQKIITPQGYTVQIYGSFAYGLWNNKSGIDLQLVRKDYTDVNNIKILEKIANILKGNGFKNVNLVNRNSRIRLDIGDGNKLRNLNIIIANDRGQNNKAVVKYITDQLASYGQLRPLFLVLKSLTVHYRLHQQKNCGVRSYTLFIMLLSLIVKWNNNDIGKQLIDFLFYFGYYYDFYQLRPDTQEYCVLALTLIDPLNHNMDLGMFFRYRVGKFVRADQMQRMFRAAYIALHSNLGKKGSLLKGMFETKRIMANY